MEKQPVNIDEAFITSSTNHRFFTISYLPAHGEPKGIVQIIPGMAEHSGRYRDFALFLAANGYGVYACDHPGQGQTAGSPELTGIADSNRGWQIMLENVRALYTNIRKTHTETPIFLFGHSMGSVIARHYTALYPVYIQGLILSGSFTMPSWQLTLLLAFIRLKILFQGSNKKSRWLNRLFYHNFNRHFKDAPTLFEWISSDRDETDSYVADPYCGFFNANGFYKNLLKGIMATKRAEELITYRKTLPILIMSGKEDPVGHFGKDAVKLHKNYYEQRFQNLSLKIFQGRHELLHEQNKDIVYQYLLNWLNESMEIK